MTHYYFTDCVWLPVNHFLFQCANTCLVFSYLVPDNLNGLFLLRFFLGTSGMFFGLWAWWILCAPDTLAWNVAFMIGNYAHAIYLFIKVKRPRKFSKDCEAVYERLFEQYGVKRFQFEQLAKKCSVLELNQGDVYGKVGMPAERISVLIQGSVDVRSEHRVLHETRPFEFLDSPEWASSEPDTVSNYGISLVAKERIRILSWQSKELRNILKKDAFLRNVFDSLIGKDVTKKLLLLTRSVGEMNLDIACYRTGSLLYMHQEVMEAHATNITKDGQTTQDALQINTSISENICSDTIVATNQNFLDHTPLLGNESPVIRIENGGMHLHKAVKLFSSPKAESTPLIRSNSSHEKSSFEQNADRETAL